MRPDIDIPVTGRRVRPGTGGLSVAPDRPENLPVHRRPPAFGGTGKDPIWSLEIATLGRDLGFRRDGPSHALLEPARAMAADEFQRALAATAPHWRKVT